MLIALGAAGVTLAVALGVLGIPAIDACSADPRGVVTCLRDMADRKFDLPGTVPGSLAEQVPDAVVQPAEPTVAVGTTAGQPADLAPSVVSEHAAPSVVVDLPPPAASSELQASEAEAVPTVAPEQPAAVAAVPEAATPEPASPMATAPTKTPATPSPPVAVELAAAPEAPVIPPPLSAADTPTDTALAWSAPLLKAPGSSPAVPVIEVPKPEADVVLPANPLPVAAAPQLEPEPAPDAPPPFDLAPVGTVPPAPSPHFDVANAEPAAAQAPPAAVAAPLVLAPTIDAIELEGAASYVSGSGPAGALMRLYADGELIGESPVEEGRWLVEGRNLLDSPRRELRVEAIEPETGKLLGFAAITVEIELPDGGAPPEKRPEAPPEFGSSVAPADIAGPAPEALAELPEMASEPPSTPVTSEPEAIAGTPEPMPIAEPETHAAEPQIEAAPIEPDPIVVPEPLPELAAVSPQRESASVEILDPSETEPSVLPPIGAIDHEPATITLEPPDAPALMAHLEVPAPKPPGQPVTVLRLLPFGDPDSGRYNVGKAIIRHGDTLWSLARRYYGHGIHYRTILNANRDVIRRASRIFPGQIFDLPLVTDD